MATTRTKLLIAFGLFVLSLCLIVVGVVSSTGSDKPVAVTKESQPKTVFYKSIGQANDIKLPSQATKAQPSQTFTLEIKVAKSRKEAEQIIDMLRGMGVKAYYTPLNRGGRIVYRIRHGLFKSSKIAERASLKLRSAKQVANRVIQL